MNIKMTYQIAVLAATVALGSMFAGKTVAQPVTTDLPSVTVTGYITCTTCLMPNTCKAQTRFSCTQWWINQGAAYVIVSDDRHYTLSGFEKDLAKAAAANSVTVTGKLDRNEITVASVDWKGKKYTK